MFWLWRYVFRCTQYHCLRLIECPPAGFEIVQEIRHAPIALVTGLGDGLGNQRRKRWWHRAIKGGDIFLGFVQYLPQNCVFIEAGKELLARKNLIHDESQGIDVGTS